MSDPIPAPSDEEALKLGAPLGITDQSKANKLALEVRQAAKAAFRREKPPRPARIPGEIDNLVAGLTKQPTTAGFVIPEGIWPYLGHEDLSSVEESYPDREELLTALVNAGKLAESTQERDFDHRGGRRRDPRMDGFAVSLSLIYSRYSGESPTITFDPDDGKFISDFGIFGEMSFGIFCPTQPVPKGTVRGALQEATNFRRDSEEMPPDDVESALTEHSSDAD